MNLTQTKPDDTGIVATINGDTRFTNRITAIGITNGTRFQTIKNDKRMPVLIYVRGTLIALNRKDAEHLEVEVDKR